MHEMWVKVLVAICLAAVQRGAAPAPSIDAERLLVSRFAFTDTEIAQARSGQAVAKLLASQSDTDIGVFGAVRIQARANRLVDWFKDIADFRKSTELGLSRRLSASPQTGDFADLSLDASDIGALQNCRAGKCDLRLGDRAIQRFQSEVDWTASNAAARANALMRQLLVGYAQAYLQGGDRSLGASQDDRTPRKVADEFHQVLWQSKTLYDIAAPLATYLEEFPKPTLPRSEQFLYWAKSDAAADASISLHHVVIYHAPSSEVYIADKQLYANRYTDAALLVVSLAPASDGSGFYALVGARARSAMLSGLAARVLRRRVESITQETTKMYLDWIRASMTI